MGHKALLAEDTSMWGEVGAGRRRKATGIQVVGEKTGHVGAMKLGRPWWRSKAMRHHRLFGNWVVTCSLDGSSDPESWLQSYSFDCFCSFALRITCRDKGERRVGEGTPNFQ